MTDDAQEADGVDQLKKPSECGRENCDRLADVAVDGTPECPTCLGGREDATGSWRITARKSRQRMGVGLWRNA